MTYLLDVNALLALWYDDHVHHARLRYWLYGLHQQHGRRGVTLATCAITELGFVRIASGVAGHSRSVLDARADLRSVKMREKFVFIGDHLGAECLPHWVTKSAQTTDGHLLILAQKNAARLATLDERIPGAELIPHGPEIETISRPPLELAMHSRCSM